MTHSNIAFIGAMTHKMTAETFIGAMTHSHISFKKKHPQYFFIKKTA